MQQEETADQKIAKQVAAIQADLKNGIMLPSKWRALHRTILDVSKTWDHNERLPDSAKDSLCKIVEIALEHRYFNQKLFRKARAAILAHVKVTDKPTVLWGHVYAAVESQALDATILSGPIKFGFNEPEGPKLALYEFQARQNRILGPLRERQSARERQKTKRARQEALAAT